MMFQRVRDRTLKLVNRMLSHDDCLPVHADCNHRCRIRVTSGITAQVKSATTQALKTALLIMKGQERITGPRVRFKTIATGKTPRKVATAIFHRGGGLCGERNHASRPCSWRYTGSPSVSVLARSSHPLNIGEA